MKKIVALLLAFVLLLGLCACGAAAPAGEGGETAAAAGSGFLVGYSKADITPEGPVAMGGYGKADQRISKGVLSYLYVTCIAITDADDNTILIYGMDLCGISYPLKYRDKISKATGVPVENMMMSASHTHSAPAYDTPTEGSADALDKLEDALVDVSVAAMEDRKEAKMYGGSIDTQGMNFVRHYLCNDGTYCGDNFGDSSSGYAGHATEADPQLQLVKFVREGDKDIYLTNFQTHPHQTGGSKKYDLSADIVGEYRIAMEKALDCEVLYLSGAGGNINSHSRIKEEQATADWRAWGVKMAEYAQQVEFTELNVGKVQVSSTNFTAEINHTDDAIAGICGNLRKQWDKGEITTAELKQIALETYGIKLNSAYHAGAISSRASMEDSNTFMVSAFSFGDVGLVAFPGEQFDTNGKFIKENAPFAMTIIATKANGEKGYFPSVTTFDYGSYECDTTRYVRGTAERLADTYVELLTAQFNNK